MMGRTRSGTFCLHFQVGSLPGGGGVPPGALPLRVSVWGSSSLASWHKTKSGT